MLTDDDIGLPPRRASNDSSCDPANLSGREKETNTPLTILDAYLPHPHFPPNGPTHATTRDTNLHNIDRSVKPPMWHPKHTSVMQVSAAGQMQANFNAEARSEVRSDDTCATKSRAVERMGKPEANPH